MIATWKGAVSNDWNNGANWSSAVAPGAGEAIVVRANSSGGRATEILDGETVNIYANVTNDDNIALASTGDQTNFVVKGSGTLSGPGALTLTNNANNRIYAGTGVSTRDNQGPTNGAGKIFSYAASPPQFFNPTGAI